MAAQKPPAVGSLGWIDLTVKDAQKTRDFYAAVVGWKATGLSMGEYDDFVMSAKDDGKPIAGVCHARGPNADLPAVWLPYFVVADLGRSVAAAAKRGGTVLRSETDMGAYGRMAVLRDPSGAACAVIEPPKAAPRATKRPAANKAVKKSAKKTAPAKKSTSAKPARRAR